MKSPRRDVECDTGLGMDERYESKFDAKARDPRSSIRHTRPGPTQIYSPAGSENARASRKTGTGSASASAALPVTRAA